MLEKQVRVRAQERARREQEERDGHRRTALEELEISQDDPDLQVVPPSP